MEPIEAQRHNLHRQVLKTLEHLRESRQALQKVFDHLKYVHNAGACANVEYLCHQYNARLEQLYKFTDSIIQMGITLAVEITKAMEHPDHRPPVIQGSLYQYRDLTPLQRALVRDGYKEIADHSKDKLPTHYPILTNEPLRKPRVLTDFDSITYKPPKRKPKKVRNEMPL